MTKDLERKVERRWGNLFKSEFEVIVGRFKELSIINPYSPMPSYTRKKTVKTVTTYSGALRSATSNTATVFGIR